MGNFKVIATGGLNIRSGPGKDYEDLGDLAFGDIIVSPGIEGWLPIVLEDDSIGWVARQYLEELPVPSEAGETIGKDIGSNKGTDEAIRTDNPVLIAMNYFMSKGWSMVQAAALVGNLMQESNLKPEAINPHSGATGIAQWLGSRLLDLQSAEDWQSLSFQLGFVDWELNNSEKAAGNALRGETNLKSAALIVRKKYERCGEAEANDANRLVQAEIALSLVSTLGEKPVSVPGKPTINLNRYIVKDHYLYLNGKKVSQRPSPNHGDEIEPEVIVIHYDGTNGNGGLSWLVDDSSGVSSHLWISKKGEVIQLLPFNIQGWHAGKSEWNGKSGVNNFSIGIENQGIGDSWPDTQIQTIMEVIRAISQAYQIIEVVGHEDIAIPKGRKVDPGPNFPWSAIK